MAHVRTFLCWHLPHRPQQRGEPRQPWQGTKHWARFSPCSGRGSAVTLRDEGYLCEGSLCPPSAARSRVLADLCGTAQIHFFAWILLEQKYFVGSE